RHPRKEWPAFHTASNPGHPAAGPNAGTATFRARTRQTSLRASSELFEVIIQFIKNDVSVRGSPDLGDPRAFLFQPPQLRLLPRQLALLDPDQICQTGILHLQLTV